MTNDRETRERLLDAAERLFAERGFKDVTVRDICREASANVAAVNYHFRDKLGLYAEVLRGATALMQEATEKGRAAGAGKPPEEKLRAAIIAHLQLLLGPRAETLSRLVHREVHEPTPTLEFSIEQVLRPRLEYLASIVAEIMGVDLSDPRVLRCVGSIQSQALMYRRNPVAERLGFRFDPTPEHIEEAARHIADFSVAGVRAIARSAGPRQAPSADSRPSPARPGHGSKSRRSA